MIFHTQCGGRRVARPCIPKKAKEGRGENFRAKSSSRKPDIFLHLSGGIQQ
jgi:hypothetical protein